MEFKNLKIGDSIYILENVGTFRKSTSHGIGIVSNISQPYDDTSVNNPYITSMLKNKLVDITVDCNGVSKKISVGANKTTITDNSIGLTLSTDKQELIQQIKLQYNLYESKIQQIESYKEELKKYKEILDKLNDQPEYNTQIDNSNCQDTIKVS